MHVVRSLTALLTLAALLAGSPHAYGQDTTCSAEETVDVGHVQAIISIAKPPTLTNKGCYDAVVTITLSYEGKFLYTDAYRYGHLTLDGDQQNAAGLQANFRRLAMPRVQPEEHYPDWMPFLEMFEASNTWTGLPEAMFDDTLSQADEVICYPVHYENGVCVAVILDTAIGLEIWKYGA